MNNQYYEYLNDINESNFMNEVFDENVYPKAFRINSMPNSFNDMIDMENFKEIMQNNNAQENCGLYSSYEGFMKGNMFPNLYSPYKGYKPKAIKTYNNQEAMMLQISELDFALVDMNLFLDVNPDDRCVINLYNDILNKRKKLVSEYEVKYGPISTNGLGLDKTPWSWNSVKSPWERGY